MAGGLSNVYFGLSLPKVFALGFSLMVAWEVVEAVLGITEAWPNQVIDVVVGLLGVTFALAVSARLPGGWRVPAFWVGFGLATVDSSMGWARSLRERRAVRNGRPAG